MSTSHVFLDFGERAPLWWVFSKGPDKPMYLVLFPREEFIGIHCGELAQEARAFDDFVNDIDGLVTRYESQLLRAQLVPLQSFRRYSTHRSFPQRRF